MGAAPPYDQVTVSSTCNYNLSTGSSGYVTSAYGTPSAGEIQFQGLPLTAPDSGQGVNWYQITVGSSGGVQETFDMYLTTEMSGGTPQIVNSGVAIDGLATVTDGSHTAKLAMLGNFGQANFNLGNDDSGHALITYTSTSLHPGR